MAKLISITENLYDELSRMKGKKLSFSGIISKMLEAYKSSADISRFAGVLKDKDVSEWLNGVEQGRKRSFRRPIADL